MLTLKLATLLIDFVTKTQALIERITQARGGKWPGSVAWAAILIVAAFGLGNTVVWLVGPEASSNALSDSSHQSGEGFVLSLRFGSVSTEPTLRVPSATSSLAATPPERKDCPQLNLSRHAPNWPYCGEQTFIESRGTCMLPEGVGDQPGIDLSIEIDAYCADLNGRFLRERRAKRIPR